MSPLPTDRSRKADLTGTCRRCSGITYLRIDVEVYTHPDKATYYCPNCGPQRTRR